MLILSHRFARWCRVRSLRGFAADDWMMITAVPLFYTGLIVCLNIIATGGGSNLFPPEQFSTFTQKEIDERIKGSKIVVISEQCMLNVIWSLKACMLFMYARMLTGTTNMKWIKAAATWVVVGWLSVEIAFFSACHPFTGYWAVPPPNPQCTTLEHFAIVQAAFNLSSDVLIIAVPIPMIVSLSLPLKQKVFLGILFSMGTFVGYGNLPRSKRQSRVPTFINSGSDDIELAHDMKSGVRAICTFDEQMQETENPFMRREEIAGTDGKGSGTGEVSGRKTKNGIVRMDVQVDTEVEIQSDRLGSQLELGQSRTVRCEGPEGQAGRW
ncbi:hypothetical protein J4E82_006691 [Alternaria postmessia]|uniref:uncharacterized protein n=1 Tax=Alternaria postmessia TaxID=1187938 RepID=UPI0022255DC8|nr:uncharacterized protein J4E82_006691 [Alternaria postmessia]KAI5374636.1 hypothetical protein J4E82_006691 [Alternaria postmessia]